MSSAASGAGPFPRRIFIPDQHIERLSRETLESVGLLPESPQPIRIDRFIYLQFGFEEEYTELPAHIMGCAKFTKRGLCRIMVNRDLAEVPDAVSHRRVRSTLAHEAGHGLLHNDLFIEKLTQEDCGQLFGGEAEACDSVTKEGFACRAEVGIHEVRPFEWWEYQANLAMSCLLLPWHLVTAAAKERFDAVLDGPGDMDSRIVRAEKEIAEVFDVNRQMVAIRLGKWWKKEVQQPSLL